MSAADDFHQTVEQVEAASSHFITGDAEPMKALYSHTDDVTIFGAWGPHEQGWEQIGPRLDWAAARFRGGKIAYTVGIERGEMRVAGRDELSPMDLRVTLIYRWENGTWKLIHRHADPITTVQAPESVIQQ
jgi:ketosteroid isomerase-like protein